jgi:hypothetical protein
VFLWPGYSREADRERRTTYTAPLKFVTNTLDSVGDLYTKYHYDAPMTGSSSKSSQQTVQQPNVASSSGSINPATEGSINPATMNTGSMTTGSQAMRMVKRSKAHKESNPHDAHGHQPGPGTVPENAHNAHGHEPGVASTEEEEQKKSDSAKRGMGLLGLGDDDSTTGGYDPKTNTGPDSDPRTPSKTKQGIQGGYIGQSPSLWRFVSCLNVSLTWMGWSEY